MKHKDISMGSKKNLIQGMDEKVARKYLIARTKIKRRIDDIYFMASFIQILEKFSDESVSVNPQSIGHLGQILARNVCEIHSILEDDFVSEIDLNI